MKFRLISVGLLLVTCFLSCSEVDKRAKTAMFHKFTRHVEPYLDRDTYASADALADAYFSQLPKGELGALEDLRSTVSQAMLKEKLPDALVLEILGALPKDQLEYQEYALHFFYPNTDAPYSLWEGAYRDHLAKSKLFEGLRPDAFDVIALHTLHTDGADGFFNKEEAPTKRMEQFNAFYKDRLKQTDLDILNANWERLEIQPFLQNQKAKEEEYQRKIACIEAVLKEHGTKHKKAMTKLVDDWRRIMDTREVGYNRLTTIEYQKAISRMALERIVKLREASDGTAPNMEEFVEMAKRVMLLFPSTVAVEIDQDRITPYFNMKQKLMPLYDTYQAIERDLWESLEAKGCVQAGDPLLQYHAVSQSGFKAATFTNMLLFCGK